MDTLALGHEPNHIPEDPPLTMILVRTDGRVGVCPIDIIVLVARKRTSREIHQLDAHVLELDAITFAEPDADC